MVAGPKIYPVTPSKSTYSHVACGVIIQAFQAVVRYWNHVQVGHRGRYSVERLLSFRDYCLRTSFSRAISICLLALIPAFVVAILVECIPLKPPSEGWRANYAFWIRLFVSSIPIAFGAVFQVIEGLQPGTISTLGIIITGVGSTTCYVGLTIVIAAVWKFPIPFGYVLTVAPFVFFYMVFFLLSIGPRVLSNSAELRHQISAKMMVIAAQGVLAIAYPTFSAVFSRLSGRQQSAFVFVLPVIKFSIKQFIAKVSVHLEECVGPIVVLSVDVCNVLYVLNCMQTAISPITTVIMITLDTFFVLLALRSIYQQTAKKQPHREFVSLNSSTSKISYLQDLIALTDKVSRGRGCSGSVLIRICAPFPLPLSTESSTFMTGLLSESKGHCGEVDVSGTPSPAPIKSVHGQMLKIPAPRNQEQGGSGKIAVSAAPRNAFDAPDYHRLAPAEPTKLGEKPASGEKMLIRGQRNLSSETTALSNLCRISSVPLILEPSEAGDNVSEVSDALQALFHSEYVVLGEFIECAISFWYAVYLACLYHLPTAAYYPHTRYLTPYKFMTTEMSLLLYTLLEFSSFIALNLLLKRKFGFSPLYQLAFVLETQVRTFQGHVVLWIMVILQITLVHNGVDFEAPFQ